MKPFTTLTLALSSIAMTSLEAVADDSYELLDRMLDMDATARFESPAVGLTVIAGGGVTGFTNPVMRDTLTSDVAPLWNLRVTLGSRTSLGVEAAYVGSTATIHSLTGAQTGTLVGTILEGGLRYNLHPNEPWDPYIAAGVGWQRYDVRNTELEMASAGIDDHDSSLIFPIALGVAYRPGRSLVVDVHGTVRANATGDLVLRHMGGNEFAPMHTWELGAALGFDL